MSEVNQRMFLRRGTTTLALPCSCSPMLQ